MPRRFRPLWVAAAALMTVAAVPPARAAGSHGGGQRLRAALSQLGLSAQQQKQVQAILAAAPARTAATTAGTAHAHGSGRALVEKVMSVLTPPQRVKLKQLLAAGRSHRRGKA